MIPTKRRRFAQVSHEYLIEQVQTENLGNAANPVQFTINFNHPVKELIFAGPGTATIAGATMRWSVVGPNDTQPAGPSTPRLMVNNMDTTTLQLKLNGHDRFAARNFGYFTRTQVSEYHSGCGGLTPTNLNAAW